MGKPRVLIIDDEFEVRDSITRILTSPKGGYDVVPATNPREGLEIAERQPFDHILCDVFMEPESGIEFLKKAKKAGIAANIIMISGKADTELALEAIRMGACDYIHKPFSAEQLFFQLRRAEEASRLRKENAILRAEVSEKYTFQNIVAKSQQMLRIFQVIEKIADYKTTVLITGESGTGKELVAKAIHYNSVRARGPFIAVNCGGIPENLLESEFFGHVKGAFTDAIRAKKGLFEEADGGAIFLDEIGDLPLSLQVKILRVLQEEEIRPVGDTRTIKIDVRVIAATAKNLFEEVRKGNFREDLFYRINVLPLTLPPLRQRKEDIPILVDHFIEKYNRQLDTAIEGVSHEAMRCLIDYAWPGNVRELENVIERAMVLTNKKILQPEDLPPNIASGVAMDANGPYVPDLDENSLSIKKASKALEKTLITRALSRTGGNKTQASQILEISLPALLYKMKDYGIKCNDYLNTGSR